MLRLGVACSYLRDQGYNIQLIAPYGSQVKALDQLGMKARTVASFLHLEDPKLDARSVLVVDEAGVMSTKTMEHTLQVATNAGARVVLLGDIQQTPAIEAGKPFAQLQAAGMRVAHMTEIKRQQNTQLKTAVEHAAQGQVKTSLQHVSEIVEIKNVEQRHQQLAHDYVKLSPLEQNKTLIVSGTNIARQAINQQVRQQLGLTGTGITVDTLQRRDTTAAQRSSARCYQVGDIIQPEYNYPKVGLKRGLLYTVIDTGQGLDNQLTVQTPEQKTLCYNPVHCRQITVYQRETRELAVGDKVKIQRHNKALNVVNGDRFTVEAATPHQLTLSNAEQKIELTTQQPLYLDHAYATTVHSAQGLTENQTFFDVETDSLTTNKSSYYVAISRARHQVRIYTDDLKTLPQAISRAAIKSSALDLEVQQSGERATAKQPGIKTKDQNKKQSEPIISQSAPPQTQRTTMHEVKIPDDGAAQQPEHAATITSHITTKQTEKQEHQEPVKTTKQSTQLVKNQPIKQNSEPCADLSRDHQETQLEGSETSQDKQPTKMPGDVISQQPSTHNNEAGVIEPSQNQHIEPVHSLEPPTNSTQPKPTVPYLDKNQQKSKQFERDRL